MPHTPHTPPRRRVRLMRVRHHVTQRPAGAFNATSSLSDMAQSALRERDAPPTVPRYLRETYWWAYVHPRSVRVFERQWLVNLILLGHYRRLRDAALDALGTSITGNTLQLACVYGDFTSQLLARLDATAQLDVIDVLSVQLENLRNKVLPSAPMRLLQQDTSCLQLPDAHYENVIAFFLLHEQPARVRHRTLAEAWRVLKPGGKLVLVDYHAPAAWHPLRVPFRLMLRSLEPYALDLWAQPLLTLLPVSAQTAPAQTERYFGGLYQRLVVTKPG